MKYLMLIYANQENWGHPIFARRADFGALPEDERQALHEQFAALLGELSEAGELVDTGALADPALTITARPGPGGVPVTTDGPFTEAKEHLAGYFLVDCAGPARAAEIATRFPDARFVAVEARPLMHAGGGEL